MTDWPRSIQPEDRIKYLINARAEYLAEFNWEGTIGVTAKLERLWIIEENGSYMAMFADDYHPEVLVGEFETIREAKKALIDFVVVAWAIEQAWEDVAS
jgi:hypothetical protein